MYMPVYTYWEITRRTRVYVDAFDILYYLDINGVLDLAEVCKHNPTVWKSRRTNTGMPDSVRKIYDDYEKLKKKRAENKASRLRR